MSKIGDRIAHLRKIKGISQTDLAKSIDASREAIGKYERNEAMPSVETAKKIADVFEVTLDFLIDETAHASFDKQTVKRLKDIDHLSEDDKKILFSMIDAFLRDAKARKAYA
jgi:transcriptional regulator with XRE-family HTH domain